MEFQQVDELMLQEPAVAQSSRTLRETEPGAGEKSAPGLCL
jgi:hypothetical protein